MKVASIICSRRWKTTEVFLPCFLPPYCSFPLLPLLLVPDFLRWLQTVQVSRARINVKLTFPTDPSNRNGHAPIPSSFPPLHNPLLLPTPLFPASSFISPPRQSNSSLIEDISRCIAVTQWMRAALLQSEPVVRPSLLLFPCLPLFPTDLGPAENPFFMELLIDYEVE